MTPQEARSFSRTLHAWYRRAKRPLPWRATRDPYAIWISEVMLQQTTVAVAGTRWRRFLDRFPDVGTLAAAKESDVLAEWSGLGYYARAKNLHRAARFVAARGGELPGTVAGLLELPGVGPYTAAAVASIAFDVPAAAVDGNVGRVLARVLAADVARATSGLEEIAHRLVPLRGAGDHTQAMMELGATVCTPRAPRCPQCPVLRFCRSGRSGRAEELPVRRARPATERHRLAAGVALRRGRLVVVEDRELVRGHGHLIVPLARVGAKAEAVDALERAWPLLAGRTAVDVEALGIVRHSVLSRRYEVTVCRVREDRPHGDGPARVISFTDLSLSPRGGLLRKVLTLADLPART